MNPIEFSLAIERKINDDPLEEELYVVRACERFLHDYGPLDDQFSRGTSYHECILFASEIEHDPRYSGKMRVEDCL